MNPLFAALRVGHSIPDENVPVINNINYVLIGINADVHEDINVEFELNERSSGLVLRQ